jgi:hypothetical protein
MKKTLSIIVTVIVATIAIVGCEQFSTSYQRVDADEFRMLKYIWDPADAAPGDTITLTAVFAGKHVDDLEKDLRWWVSFNVIRDLYGTTTVVDSQRLERGHFEFIDVINPYNFSPNTQAIQFKFRIPPDIVRNSASIPDAWADMIPAGLKEMIPPAVEALTKTEIVDNIEKLYAAGVNSIDENDKATIISILQYFTVPMRVFTKHNLGKYPQHTITSTQYIRYNNKFKDAGIPVNRAPRVDSVVVYKVKGGDVSNIDNKRGLNYETIPLNNTGNSVIEVEKGYSYFLDAITSDIDTTVTMSGLRLPERHEIYRQFKLDSDETAGVHHSKFMDIDNNNGKITFPSDRRITKFVFWLTVYDEVNNERLRPEGGTLVEVSGRLVYK